MSEHDDDPRVETVVRGEVEGDELSAAEQAQLASWFGAPAAVPPHLADESAPVHDESDGLAEGPTRHQQWQRATFDIDPEFMARLDRQETDADTYRAHLPTLEVSNDRFTTVTGAHRWALGSVHEARETERPWDLDESLAEVSPQAILRDLHRPVPHFGSIKLERTLLGTGAGAMIHTTKTTRAIMCTRYRIDINDFPTARIPIEADMAELRAQLDQPWDEIDASPGQTETELTPSELRALQMKWFG